MKEICFLVVLIEIYNSRIFYTAFLPFPNAIDFSSQPLDSLLFNLSPMFLVQVSHCRSFYSFSCFFLTTLLQEINSKIFGPNCLVKSMKINVDQELIMGCFQSVMFFLTRAV